jgi:hypothetical protein
LLVVERLTLLEKIGSEKSRDKRWESSYFQIRVQLKECVFILLKFWDHFLFKHARDFMEVGLHVLFADGRLLKFHYSFGGVYFRSPVFDEGIQKWVMVKDPLFLSYIDRSMQSEIFWAI